MMLSVILCTYNRERYIYNVLESIAAGGYGDYEIVLVNNNSTDGTEGECQMPATAASGSRRAMCWCMWTTTPW